MSATGAPKHDNDLPDWDGCDKTYSRFARKIAKHKRANKEKYMDSKFWSMPDPRLRTRITTRRRATENDPTGTAEGEWVERETADEYTEKCDQYAECESEWFETLGASLVGGKAEDLVEKMTAKKQKNGKALEAGIKHIYQEKTTKNLAGTYMNWITTQKPPMMSTEDWNVTWNKTRTTIERNLEWEQMRIYIYLKTLGESNRAFYDITTTQKGKLDLETVQSEADDWDKDKQRGEGKIQDIAMMAQQRTPQQTTRGTGRMNSDCSGTPFDCNHPHWLTVPCVACPEKNKSKHFHCMRDCFDGGLSHLSDEEKDAWLEMKRKVREKKNGHSNHQPQHQKRRWGGGHRGGNEHADMATELATLRAQVQEQHEMNSHLDKVSQKAEEHGLEREFEPIVKKAKIYMSQKSGPTMYLSQR